MLAATSYRDKSGFLSIRSVLERSSKFLLEQNSIKYLLIKDGVAKKKYQVNKQPYEEAYLNASS